MCIGKGAACSQQLEEGKLAGLVAGPRETVGLVAGPFSTLR